MCLCPGKALQRDTPGALSDTREGPARLSAWSQRQHVKTKSLSYDMRREAPGVKQRSVCLFCEALWGRGPLRGWKRVRASGADRAEPVARGRRA